MAKGKKTKKKRDKKEPLALAAVVPEVSTVPTAPIELPEETCQVATKEDAHEPEEERTDTEALVSRLRAIQDGDPAQLGHVMKNLSRISLTSESLYHLLTLVADPTVRDELAHFLLLQHPTNRATQPPTEEPFVTSPDSECLLRLLLLKYLMEDGSSISATQQVAVALIKRVDDLKQLRVQSTGLEDILAKAYFYLAVACDKELCMSDIGIRLSSAEISGHSEKLASLICLRIRMLLADGKEKPAAFFLAKNAIPEDVSTDTRVLSLYCLGYVKAMELNFSEALKFFQEAKELPGASSVFKKMEKWAIVVGLLLRKGNSEQMEKDNSIKPYIELVQAYHRHEHAEFKRGLEMFENQFRIEGILSLMEVLRISLEEHERVEKEKEEIVRFDLLLLRLAKLDKGGEQEKHEMLDYELQTLPDTLQFLAHEKVDWLLLLIHEPLVRAQMEDLLQWSVRNEAGSTSSKLPSNSLNLPLLQSPEAQVLVYLIVLVFVLERTEKIRLEEAEKKVVKFCSFERMGEQSWFDGSGAKAFYHLSLLCERQAELGSTTQNFIFNSFAAAKRSFRIVLLLSRFANENCSGRWKVIPDVEEEPFPEDASAMDRAHFLFSKGKIQAKKANYTSAISFFEEGKPTGKIGRALRIAIEKWISVCSLLQGEMLPIHGKYLSAYREIQEAVREGNTVSLNDVLQKNESLFQQDETIFLLERLRQLIAEKNKKVAANSNRPHFDWSTVQLRTVLWDINDQIDINANGKTPPLKKEAYQVEMTKLHNQDQNTLNWAAKNEIKEKMRELSRLIHEYTDHDVIYVRRLIRDLQDETLFAKQPRNSEGGQSRLRYVCTGRNSEYKEWLLKAETQKEQGFFSKAMDHPAWVAVYYPP